MGQKYDKYWFRVYLILTSKYTPFWRNCQYWGRIKHMHKYQKQIAVAILILVFSVVFIRNTRSDFPLIFQKDLHAHDESSNSVVAANTTRKFFPPMVRVNPLVEEQGNWMEGPYWQHIPPLFAYVPYLFFQIDGQITIEVKRLAFALLTLLTGLLFIFGVYRYKNSFGATLAATLAAIAWVNTPFTHELITGYAFGVSDIVLAFTVVASFVSILWYLREEREVRVRHALSKLILIGIIVALPIAAKNLLGAIPAATFFILLLRDHRKISQRVIIPASSFIGILLLYLLSLYFSSPETFKNEILISFFHFQNLEGWGRPWHYYLSDYLPHRYLFGWTWYYFAGFIVGMAVLILKRRKLDLTLLYLAGGWFLWNLVAISLVESKIANFIYQTYLLSLFFIFYSIYILLKNVSEVFRPPLLWKAEAFRYVVAAGLIVSVVAIGYESTRFVQKFNFQRAQAYKYQSENEKFYQAAEQFQKMGLNQKDLVIVRVSNNDCWFRYPIIFLTGAESKTLLEFSFGFDANKVKEKYNRMYFIFNKQSGLPEIGDYSFIEFNVAKMSDLEIKQAIQAFLDIHKSDLEQDILRIKKVKTSCQWLVPDAILNAP